MKVKIVETCVYEVEAADGDAAERLFIEKGPMDPVFVTLVGVTSRHVLEPRTNGMTSETHRFAEPGKVLAFPDRRDAAPVVA